jgi:protein SERAC1
LRDRALVPSKIVDTEGQLLDALQEGSEVLANITDMFVLLMKDFYFFFWEQEKTNMGVTQDHVRQSSSLDRDFRC